jgi:hypothetical protein
LNGQGEPFENWKSATGLDGNSTFRRGQPASNWIFVRPNRFELGRANITIYNWTLASSVSVDVSKVLTVGSHFVVRNAQDFFIAPVLSGVYKGGSIAIPMTGLTVAPAYGIVTAQPKPTGPSFGAFVVLTTDVR